MSDPSPSRSGESNANRLRSSSPSVSVEESQERLRRNLSRMFNTPLDLPPYNTNPRGRHERPFTPPPTRSTRVLTPVRSAATPPPVRSARMARAPAASSAGPAALPPSGSAPQFTSPQSPLVQAAPKGLALRASSSSSSSSSSSGCSLASAPTAAQASPFQASPFQASTVQASPAQASAVQASSVQASPVQASPVQASPVQASPVQASTVQAFHVQASPASPPVSASPSTPPVCCHYHPPPHSRGLPPSPLARTTSASPPMPSTSVSGPTPVSCASSTPPVRSMSSPIPIPASAAPTPSPCSCPTCLMISTVSEAMGAPPGSWMPSASASAFSFPPMRSNFFPPGPTIQRTMSGESLHRPPVVQEQRAQSGGCLHQHPVTQASAPNCRCRGSGPQPSGTPPVQTFREPSQAQSGVSECCGRCDNACCPLSRSMSQPASSEPRGASGGVDELIEHLRRLGTSRSWDGQARTSSPVCGHACGSSRQDHQCAHFDPWFNYATHPAARAYNLANCQSSAYGCQLSGANNPASHTAPHPFKGGCQAGYATVPPMTPSMHGWTHTRAQTTADHIAASSQGSSHCGQEFRGRDRSQSDPQCPGHMSSTCSRHQSWEADSNGTASTADCGQCQGRHGNMPCLTSLPPMRDFLLKRFLEEVISFPTFLNPSPGFSPFHLPYLTSCFPPGPMFPNVSFPSPPFTPLYPPSFPMMHPQLLNGGPVMFAALGRFLANCLLESGSKHQSEESSHHLSPGQKLDTFNALYAALNAARTSEESWKAFGDLVTFQARCLRDRSGGGVAGCPATQPSNTQEAFGDANKVPLQPGHSEDISGDFMLFCMLGQMVLTPPLY